MSERAGYLIRRVHQISSALVLQRLADWGLTPMQFIIVLSLGDSGPVDQSTVARMAAIDRSTAADVIRRLESKGLLVREAGTVDKRQVVVRLSKSGQELLARTQPLADAINEEFLAPLARYEREFLATLLQRLIDRHAALLPD